MTDQNPPDDPAPLVTRDESGFTVDATLIAQGLDLPLHAIARAMSTGAITTRHERGEGEDEGRFRLNFLYRGRTFRLTVDGEGRIISQARFGAAPE
ncbi:DUF6522 family protein [Paracoccus jeotgali]|uniref:Uncharacterized protein n=1 Tax=Paracoccus jeotgali TaxID=2065379 RepID=A0A2K9MDR6_9RHOB|nr:DUF6522 family protein [Paracoccus jeotgali]AUM73166.1 hypothetical protein CYR75_01650 [Paracoccus jeotgali]